MFTLYIAFVVFSAFRIFAVFSSSAYWNRKSKQSRLCVGDFFDLISSRAVRIHFCGSCWLINVTASFARIFNWLRTLDSVYDRMRMNEFTKIRSWIYQNFNLKKLTQKFTNRVLNKNFLENFDFEFFFLSRICKAFYTFLMPFLEIFVLMSYLNFNTILCYFVKLNWIREKRIHKFSPFNTNLKKKIRKFLANLNNFSVFF